MTPDDDRGKIKAVANVSDPPDLSTDDLLRIQQESQRLHDAFMSRTASMEDIIPISPDAEKLVADLMARSSPENHVLLVEDIRAERELREAQEEISRLHGDHARAVSQADENARRAIAAEGARTEIVAWLRTMSWRKSRDLGLQSDEAQRYMKKIADAIERGEWK